MIARYRKRPVVIDACQWTGDNLSEVLTFVGETRLPCDNEDRLYITTLEGGLWASVGDFIIRGLAGEFDSCKPDIFARTYARDEDTGHVDLPEAL